MICAYICEHIRIRQYTSEYQKPNLKRHTGVQGVKLKKTPQNFVEKPVDIWKTLCKSCGKLFETKMTLILSTNHSNVVTHALLMPGGNIISGCCSARKERYKCPTTKPVPTAGLCLNLVSGASAGMKRPPPVLQTLTGAEWNRVNELFPSPMIPQIEGGFKHGCSDDKERK